MYDLYSDFDIKQHKEHYIHYLEVILFPDGHIEYAVPSHQEKLINIAREKLQVSRQELFDMCPNEYAFDVITWLCNITGCVSIWENSFCKSDKNKLTDEQVKTIKQLQDEDLFLGGL